VRAYATNSSGTYYGADIPFTTSCGAVTVFPWNEGFENSGAIPACWTQEQVNGSGINWTFIAGSGNGNPAAAHSGTYNACLKDGTSADNKTRLIAPPMDLTSVPAPQLIFWHTQAPWSGDQDQLAVFYKSSAAGSWTLLASYTGSITTWTQETISLPDPTGDYYIAFEGNAKWGYGVCLDDVQVSTSCGSLLPVSVTIAADANPVNGGTTVNFTAAPVNGGTTPAYQWKVNSNNAGSDNAVFAYVPLSGDQVSCILTSSETCATGNPATSNVITMTVISIPATLDLQNLSVADTACYNATQTITVAGAGTLFTVQNGGSVTMIAGQNIDYLPGTRVDPGGYMSGYITTNGQYCSPPARTVVSAISAEPPEPSGSATPLFRIYPNPTTSVISLDISAPDPSSAIRVEIYSFRGEKIFSGSLPGKSSHEFTLLGHPAGIYFIRIIAGNFQAAAKIIKLD